MVIVFLEIFNLFIKKKGAKCLIKSRIGIAFAAAAVILALSPEARKRARKLAVKGAEIFLDLSDRIKESTAGLQSNMENKTNIDQDFIDNQLGKMKTQSITNKDEFREVF
jgi:hypothetical protein